MRRRARKPGIPAKLQNNYIGPFQILHQTSLTSFRVGDLASKRKTRRQRIFDAHTCQLKRWTPPLRAGDAEIAAEWSPIAEESDVEESTAAALELSSESIATPVEVPPDAPIITADAAFPPILPLDSALPATGRPRREIRRPAAFKDFVMTSP